MSDLLPYLHFEKQEGNLCAQHCLNNLLQGDYFNVIELSKIAADLDALQDEQMTAEESQRIRAENVTSPSHDDGADRSHNMDDSGFFSVHVIERALQVWGLRLVRWASEEVRQSQGANKPEDQIAFILNLDAHWYALRRFGNASQRWYNLDSRNATPTWISPTFLGMQLVDGESEGYSVFSVMPIDATNPSPLPHCDADDIAVSFPQEQKASTDDADELEKQMLEAAMRDSLAMSANIPHWTSAEEAAMTSTSNFTTGKADDEVDRALRQSKPQQNSTVPEDNLEQEIRQGPSVPALPTTAYADEDADLQAALKASLEESGGTAASPAAPMSGDDELERALQASMQTSQCTSEYPTATTSAAQESESSELDPTEEVSAEQMRLRRLARFNN